MTDTEHWKAVPGYEGLYEVSDLGRVRSLDRVVPVRLKSGLTERRLPGVDLRPGTDSAGYQSVVLGKNKSFRVHWLVLLAFVGPCPDGFHRLHNDGDRANNALSNLRYGSRSDNVRDMFTHGQRRLNEAQVSSIRAAKARGFARGERKALAAKFGVSLSTVNDVAAGRTYAYVG